MTTRIDEFNAKLARKERQALEAQWLHVSNLIAIAEVELNRNGGDDRRAEGHVAALVKRRRQIEAQLDAAPQKQRPGPKR